MSGSGMGMAWKVEGRPGEARQEGHLEKAGMFHVRDRELGLGLGEALARL